MILIELAGAPGAGKTTLLPAVLRTCEAAGLQAYTVEGAARAFARRTVVGRLAHRLPARQRQRALWGIYRVLSALGALSLAIQHRSLVRYVAASQRGRPHDADTRQRRVLYWYVRTMGSVAFVRAQGRLDDVVVVDEGFVHRALQLHASAVEQPEAEAVRRYVALLPPADVVVVVRAPEETCRRRVAARGVWDRLAHRDPEEIDAFVRNAHEAIELASAAVRSSSVPVVEVDNTGNLARAEAELALALRRVLHGFRPTELQPPLPRRAGLPGARHLVAGVAATVRSPVIDPVTCAAILGRYGTTAVGRPSNVTSGRRNLNVVLTTEHGKVILRRHRETAPLASVLHEHAILRELERAGYPAVRLLARPDGATVTEADGRLYSVFAFEQGARPAARTRTAWQPALLGAAGRTLGGFHDALKGFVPRELHHLDHTSEDREVDRRLAWHLQALDALPQLPIPPVAGADGPAVLDGQRRQLAERLLAVDEDLQEAQLPTTVIHGDFGLHNLLLRSDGSLVVHDLELARRDWRLVDLVIVLARLGAEQRRAFLEGYRTGTRCTDEELRHLPAAWEHYHLTGAIRSWSNYVRYGGEQRLRTAAERLARAQVRPEEVVCT